MGRRDFGWVYTGKERSRRGPLDLYVGQHDGPNPQVRLNQHFKGDAEWTRYADIIEQERVHRDDLDHEEQLRIKAANNGQGTVFNRVHNRGTDYQDRFRAGHMTRDDPDEKPDHKLRRQRRAQGGDHPSYVAWQAREAKRRAKENKDLNP